MPRTTTRLFVFCSMIVLLAACNDAGDSTSQVESHVESERTGCHGPEECSQDELCVASDDSSANASCVARCSIEDGDVCPVGEYCAKVIGMSGDHAAACIEGTVESQKSWQNCTNHDQCSDGESCVELDEVLGARCIPSCDVDDNCADTNEVCALHWDGEHGAQSGCVRQCEDDEDCAVDWQCRRGADVSGICVR